MSLMNKGIVEKSFEDLSDSICESDRIIIETRLLMYRFLSEIDRITRERGINRKELAELAGVSASYLTQLYQGKKIINLQLLTRIKKALNIDFKIGIIYSDEKEKKDCPDISIVQIAQAGGKRATHVAVHRAHLPGKLIQTKNSKSEPRARRTF
jgi:transcriptional regulator with XRE-family HTH domain